jgi:glucose-6-phosphate dehydrogenase assembly protein OpcA
VSSALTIEPGLPVEIGRIDKQLGKLWEESGDTKTRASLVNFAIYTEDAAAVPANTEIVSQIASEHACRALLIFANPSAPTAEAKAWISAHCHIAGKGERQVCSEQITFQLDGQTVKGLPNIVFSHLDSDLPLYFWWQGEFHAPLDKKLWVWMDRLIYDSSEWKNPREQFALVKEIGQMTEARTVMCDLNWSRLLGTRFALAQLFDHSCALARLETIQKVSITCSHHLTGLLLLGWLAAQLNWKFQSLLGKKTFVTSKGGHVEFEILQAEGASISRCFFECADRTFEIVRDGKSEYYHANISGEGASEAPMMVSGGKSDLTDILLSELNRGGKHPLYAKALRAIEPLFD